MNYWRTCVFPVAFILVMTAGSVHAQRKVTGQQRANWLKRFPAADTNKDGKLSDAEIRDFAQKFRGGGKNRGVKRNFKVDPGWKLDKFPDEAICYLSPDKIADVYKETMSPKERRGNKSAVTSYDKPADGSLRIVGTGHSFMAPGYKTFPAIARLAGYSQPPLLTHTGGGMTGSSRYIWEHENGIFGFKGQPLPKLLASISNAKWDAMTWGPYFQDQPEYYACWIEFCLKYNPDMKFYMSDAWPQLEQFKQKPKSEADLTYAALKTLGEERNEGTAKLIGELNEKFPGKVFVMPTSDAMVLAVREFHAGNLPGIKGVHKALGGKERSLWRDQLGHLGPGLGDLEGYVFYATLYQKSPESIAGSLKSPESKNGFPGPELDKVFRRIAWEAVTNNPLSGVKP